MLFEKGLTTSAKSIVHVSKFIPCRLTLLVLYNLLSWYLSVGYIFSMIVNHLWILLIEYAETNLNLIEMAERFPKTQKTLWKKGKMLVKSKFSFFHSVFKKTCVADR